jgi:hypothetical protein
LKATDQHPAGAEGLGYVPLWDGEEEVTVDARKRAWTRLLAKLCEADPSVARSAAVGAVLSRNLALECRFAVALPDKVSYPSEVAAAECMRFAYRANPGIDIA